MHDLSQPLDRVLDRHADSPQLGQALRHDRQGRPLRRRRSRRTRRRTRRRRGTVAAAERAPAAPASQHERRHVDGSATRSTRVPDRPSPRVDGARPRIGPAGESSTSASRRRAATISPRSIAIVVDRDDAVAAHRAVALVVHEQHAGVGVRRAPARSAARRTCRRGRAARASARGAGDRGALAPTRAARASCAPAREESRRR